MKIVVLCGGLSPERDVSLTSGTKAAAALRRKGHRVLLMDLFHGYPHPYRDIDSLFTAEQDDAFADVAENVPDLDTLRSSRQGSSRMGSNVIEICQAADIVFMGLHGADGEDGKIQAAFDLLGIRYTGTGAFGSTLAMNKSVAKLLFEKNGIRTPKGITVCKSDSVPDSLGFPCVVKPESGGSSIGTSIVENSEDYQSALDAAFQYDDTAVVEQYIKGRECDVGVISGKALPVIEICPKSGFYDYKTKYQSGLADDICPADLPEEITCKLQEAAEAVFRVLHFDIYGRMDFIVDADGHVWCLEGNTLPGLTNLSLLPQEAAAAGIPYDELCVLIVEESMKRYEEAAL